MTLTAPKPPSMPQPINKLPVGKPQADAIDVALNFGPTELKPTGTKILLAAVEGFGKTSLGAYATKPIIVTGPRETGYYELLKYDRVPNIPSRQVSKWPELRAVTQKLAVADHDIKWTVWDSGSVMEAMCRQHVCDTHFDGDWGERGFASFGKGEDRTAVEWMAWLADLERLTERGINVLLLCHTAVKTIKNPEGADYDSFQPDLRDKVKAATNRWANAILFGRFVTAVEVDKQAARKSIVEQKGKGVGGTMRVLRCENRDSATAKNQQGLPDVIDIPDDHTKTFETLNQYLKT